MASGVGSKYHIALATLSTTGLVNSSFIGYLLRGRGYQRIDAKLFAPRFGTGEQGLGDLDFYKTWQQDDFSGGSFQEYWDNSTKVSLIDLGLRNPINNMIYPVPASTNVTVPTAAGNVAAGANVTYKGTVYVITNGAGTGTGGVSTYNPGTYTLSLLKGDFTDNVAGMAVVAGKLMVCGNNIGLWTYDGTTWAQIATSANWSSSKMRAFNNKAYMNGTSGTNVSGKLYSHDGTTGSAIGDVGDSNVAFNDMLVYNHRLYIAKPDGLFAYDGVQISTILDQTIVPEGILSMAVVQGQMYLLSGNKVFRFDGVTIEVVQQFANYEYPDRLFSAYGRLWITTLQQSIYAGKGTLSGYNYNLYMYDGMGICRYDYINFSASGSTNYASTNVFYINNQIVYIKQYSGSAPSSLSAKAYQVNQEFLAGNSAVSVITTSQFDAAFPTLDKMAAAIKVQGENLDPADTIAVAARFYDGLTWTAYIALGNITSTVNKIDLVKALQGTAGSLSFKRIQLQFTFTRISTSKGAFKSFALEYAIAPPLRREWTLSLIAQGQSDAPLILADNVTKETNTAAQLRDWIYHFRANVPPLVYQDIDTTTLTGAHTNSITTITVGSTATFGFEAGDLITIDDELIQIGAVTATSFTGCTRAMYGTAAAAHADQAIVIATYRVVLTKIQNESVISPGNIDGKMNSYGNESELTITLSEAK